MRMPPSGLNSKSSSQKSIKMLANLEFMMIFEGFAVFHFRVIIVRMRHEAHNQFLAFCCTKGEKS